MAQVRRPVRYRSPPARQIPILPNPVRLRPLSQKKHHSVPRTTPQNSFAQHENTSVVSGEIQPASLKNTNVEESVILPALNSEVPEKKHLPVYAHFPFNVSFLPQPMETNVEDNIHKLRLRLIDSELKHQRRSTDEYIKRTQTDLFHSSPTPTEFYVHNLRPPSELVRREIRPITLSRQTPLSVMSLATSPPPSSSGLLRDRIGMDNDLERELEIRRIQASLNKRSRSNHSLIPSNHSYDSRVHLQSLDEDQTFTSSNMDDLIDSMARRHLAYRRLDAAIDQQRRSVRHRTSHIEPMGSGRLSHRNDDLLVTYRSPRHDHLQTNPHDSNQILRSRIDSYNRILPDSNGMGIDDSFRTNSYNKLPPIPPGHEFNRLDSLRNPSTGTLYDNKRDTHMHRSNLSNQSEHLIDLPSDIFLSSRTEGLTSSHRHRSTHGKHRLNSNSKDVTDRSDVEHDESAVNHRDGSSENSQNIHGFFTESYTEEKMKPKVRRNLFRKAAVGVLFTITLKHRAKKNQANRTIQSPSATIHKIRLQEIIVALHRVYLEPDGPIYNALVQAISTPVSLQEALNRSSRHYSDAIKLIGTAAKNSISKITEFMPKDGILGTAKDSAVSAFMQDGNPFPENYFWQCERELLKFDHSKVIHINKQRARLLLIGLFIFRALVTTLLIKPIKYRLVMGQLTSKQSASLKVLASVMLYIGRRAAGTSSQPLPVPPEWQLSLHTDADLQTILEHSEIKSVIDTCSNSLHTWCDEYIRRIDASFDKELRP